MTTAHETLVCTAELESLGQARHWVRDNVRGVYPRVPPVVVDDVTLLTSELVTLALQDGGGQLRVRLTGDGYALRIDVTDEHPEGAARLHSPPDDAVARALDVVHGLADDWGWRVEGTGHKIVWAMVVIPDV